MIFYIKTTSTGRWYNPIGSKPNYHHELISVSILCENGNKYYAVSTNYSKSKVDQYAKTEVIPYLPVSHGLHKPLHMIADDIRTFVDYNASGSDIYFVGLDCDQDSVMLKNIYGTSSAYPYLFPTVMIDLRQSLMEIAMPLPDKHFQEGDKYTAVAGSESKLTLADKMNVIASHEDFPSMDSQPYTAFGGMVLYISEVHKFIKAFKESVTAADKKEI